MSSSPAAAAAPVSVQLTPIVPVRVFDAHGEYFDVELDIDAPLRALQLAIEDYFKMKPEVQLLLHNRQQVHPDRTLRDNGCLLLKGDPYVRLVCLLKRGPVLNLQCEVGPVTYVIACHETTTVWEVKRMLCEEMQRQQRRGAPQDGDNGAAGRRLACGPERLRLLWRYMELNDRATLHYYRIATNAVLHVMHRRRAVGAPQHESRATSREAAGRGRTVVASSSPAAATQPSPASATVWWQRPPPPVEYHDAFTDLGPQRQTAATQPPPPLPPPQPAAYPPPQAAPTTMSAAAVPLAAPPPLLPPRSDPLTSAEAASLSHAVRSLEVQLQTLRQEQRQVEAYQQSLSANQRGSLADAQQRILELEETVLRFHALLQRTVALLPAA